MPFDLFMLELQKKDTMTRLIGNIIVCTFPNPLLTTIKAAGQLKNLELP